MGHSLPAQPVLGRDGWAIHGATHASAALFDRAIESLQSDPDTADDLLRQALRLSPGCILFHAARSYLLASCDKAAGPISHRLFAPLTADRRTLSHLSILAAQLDAKQIAAHLDRWPGDRLALAVQRNIQAKAA